MRKGVKKKRISFVLVIVLIVVFVKFAMLVSEYKPKEEEELGLVVSLNLEGDFPNPEEGTAIYNLKLLMDQIILKFKKVPKYVIFTESKAIPGLVFRYNVHDSVFEGGLPLIKSREVVFLDGNQHEVVYTFKKGAEQRIYFDKEEVASSIFDPSRIGITGFVVGEDEKYEVVTIPIDGSVEILAEAR